MAIDGDSYHDFLPTAAGQSPPRRGKRGVMTDFTFYVAGPFADRPHVREIIAKINAAGWRTCSRWADSDNPDIDPDDPEREAKLRLQAIRDIEDVVKADGLIYVNSQKSEGKATELGISIAMLKPVIIIGTRENNIFLNLRIPAYPTIEDALEWLKGAGALYLQWVLQQQLEHARLTAPLDNEDLARMEPPSE